jgi:hypothetical protein
MPSAIGQAITQAPTVLPSPIAAANPHDAERWFASLPAQAQQQLKVRLTAIVLSLPPAAQLGLQRYLAENEVPPPMEMGVSGLGDGEGWGALAAGLIQAGASLYNTQQSAHAQSQIAANQASSNNAIQQMLLAAQAETNAAVIAAQRDAAIAAEVAKTQRATIYAPTFKWLAIGIGALAVFGGGTYFFTRPRR